METKEITLTLPADLCERAEEAVLLSTEKVTAWLRESLAQKPIAPNEALEWVERTWGMLKIDPDLLERILTSDEYDLFAED
jgi:hypothetical protein